MIVECEACAGETECQTCHGDGHIDEGDAEPDHAPAYATVRDCEDCDGTGKTKIRQLRDEQKQQADAMTAFLESRLRLPLQAGTDALDRARDLLKKYGIAAHKTEKP